MRYRLEQQERKLDQLFQTIQEIEDEEEQAILAKFLCIRTSGFLETSVRNLIGEFMYKSSPQQIQSFVNKEIKYITNLKFDRLCQVLSNFDTNWKDQFIEQISDEQKASINSIVSNRNNIAHGENDSISYHQMVKYYENAKEVVAILKDIIKK